MTQDKNIKLSFVIPVYNAESYLKKCVDSILASKQKNIEMILVDDGSTDQSGKICDSYSEIYSNIKTIHKKNEGVASARNTGIQESSGDYIFFIDNDDWVESSKIKYLLEILDRTSADIIINKYLIISEKENSIGNNFIDPNKINKKSQEEVLNYFKNKRINIMAPWEYVIKREILINNSLFFDIKQAGVDDSCFTPILFCNCNSFYFNDDIVYFWKQRKDSQSRTHDKNAYIKKMISTIENLYEHTEITREKYKKEYLYFSIHKNTYSLLGQYYSYNKKDKQLLVSWYDDNKRMVENSIKNSGKYHKMLCVLFGTFYGIILSYRLAVFKGSIYIKKHKV